MISARQSCSTLRSTACPCSLAVRLEGPGHASSVKPLPPIVRVRKALVHIDIRIVKMQNQVGWINLGGLIGIPTIGQQHATAKKTVTFVAVTEGVIQEALRQLILRLLDKLHEHRLTHEHASVLLVALQKLRSYRFDSEALQNPAEKELIQ
jgi:hypothetical protein